MGLFDFFRRKKRTNASAPKLREIWCGFQQILADNNEVMGLIGNLEEMLVSQKDLDLPYLNSRIWLLDQHVASLVTVLQKISGAEYLELESARVRVKEAIHQRLEEAAPFPASPLIVRLEEAGPELLAALGARRAIWPGSKTSWPCRCPTGRWPRFRPMHSSWSRKLPGGGGTLLSRLKSGLHNLDLGGEGLVGQVSQELQNLILAQPIPPELASALIQAAQRLAPEGGHTLTVRSSGGRGRYRRVFCRPIRDLPGVSPEEVPDHWRRVVAASSGRGPLFTSNSRACSWKRRPWGS